MEMNSKQPFSSGFSILVDYWAQDQVFLGPSFTPFRSEMARQVPKFIFTEDAEIEEEEEATSSEQEEEEKEMQVLAKFQGCGEDGRSGGNGRTTGYLLMLR